MKKRIFAGLMALLLLLPFAACQKSATAPEELETIRKSTAGKHAYFAPEESNTALRLRLPTDWSYEQEDDTLLIMEDDAVIGTVTLGKAEESEGMTEAETVELDDVTILTETGVQKKEDGKNAWYRLSYTFEDDEESRTVTVEILNEEMDATLYKWLKRPEILPIKDYHKRPDLSLAGGNGKGGILIAGNSFVSTSTSAISVILRDMIATGGKTCGVASCSIGYASAKEWVNNTANENYSKYMNNIKKGTYHTVFMCGLYSADDVAAFASILAACQQSNTRLVIFPAHNENSTHIASAAQQYPQLTVLNWKAEIDALIDTGLQKSDFCINDEHSHSNRLAGYVGAKMIYQSLFGAAPPALSANCEPISQAEVDAKLAGHKILPTVLIEEKDINRIP